MTGISTCLCHATAIQRRYPLDQWHTALANVPEECRPEVKAYLRIMADRVRLADATKTKLTQLLGALK